MKRLTIKFHFPHDRCALGWEIYYPDEEYDTHVINLFLLIITLEIEF